MKKQTLIGLCAGLVLLPLASCSTISKTATTLPIASYVLQSPTVADLDVSPKRVTKTITYRRKDLKEMKKHVVAELCAELGCDVIVQPQYVHEKRKSGKHILTVTGFPANYQNFRTATSSDLEALRAGDPDLALISETYGDQLEQYRNDIQAEMKKADKKKKDKKKKEDKDSRFSLKRLLNF